MSINWLGSLNITLIILYLFTYSSLPKQEPKLWSDWKIFFTISSFYFHPYSQLTIKLIKYHLCCVWNVEGYNIKHKMHMYSQISFYLWIRNTEQFSKLMLYITEYISIKWIIIFPLFLMPLFVCLIMKDDPLSGLGNFPLPLHSSLLSSICVKCEIFDNTM